MSPSIDITDENFRRLQAHAEPLVDTIDTVVARILDTYEQKERVVPSDGGADGQGLRSFNPNTPPDLTHAKILGATFGDHKLGRGQDNWNGLLHFAVKEAKAQATSEMEFKDLMVINYVNGDKHNEGYRPLPGTGISVQGQDANGAWRGVCHIAQQLGCALSVKFAWREKEGAAYPGVIGQLTVEPR